MHRIHLLLKTEDTQTNQLFLKQYQNQSEFKNLKINTTILELHSSINLKMWSLWFRHNQPDWSGQMFYNNLNIKCNLQYAYQQVTVQSYSTQGSTAIRYTVVSSHHSYSTVLGCQHHYLKSGTHPLCEFDYMSSLNRFVNQNFSPSVL